MRFPQFNPQTKGDHEDNRDGPGLCAYKGRGDQRQARNWQDNATTPKAAKVIPYRPKAKYIDCNRSPDIGIGRGQVTGQYKAVRRKRSEWTQEVGGKPCTKTERGEIKANNSVKNRVNAILAKLGWNEVGLTTSGKKFHKLRGWNVTQVIENEGLKAGSVHAGHRSTKTTSAWYHLPAAEQDKEYIANKLLR